MRHIEGCYIRAVPNWMAASGASWRGGRKGLLCLPRPLLPESFYGAKRGERGRENPFQIGTERLYFRENICLGIHFQRPEKRSKEKLKKGSAFPHFLLSRPTFDVDVARRMEEDGEKKDISDGRAG